MIVGRTGAGKSEAWKCLSRAMAQLKKEGAEGEFERVSVYTINPLALSNDEIYGSFDPGTHEWTDGVLARIMRTVCKDEGLDQKWILFDGPVDTLWIESMNTLLDDNKLLTLLSGERISMPPQVSILFEVEDLKQASPATVSRAGMIYLNVEDLGWAPFVKSWLQRKEGAMAEMVGRLVEKYVGAALEFRRRNCRELVGTDQLAAVRQLTFLYDSLATPENGVASADGEAAALAELWFAFAVCWSIGASVDDDGRRRFDAFLRELTSVFPPSDTVYDFWVDPKRKAWAQWEEKLSQNFRPPPELPFFKIMIPTVDTVRTRYVVSALVTPFRHTMIVGNVGVGKTMIAQSVLANLPEGRSSMTINFSAQTSSNSLQDTIEGKLEKRTKGVFAPAGGKKLVCYIDDFNMPKKSVFGFMPPLELLKLWVDNGFWYDRAKQEVKQIRDMQLLISMAPPGGGRNAFSARVLASYSLVNVTNPSDAQLCRIFSSMLHARLSSFDDEIKPLAEPVAAATVDVFNAIAAELLPTPSKSHYLFNTRDLAKVIQGVMQATRQYYDSKEALLQLWCHECTRVFGDRMWDANDRAWLRALLDQKLAGTFSTSLASLFENGEMTPFASFMRQVESPPYEAITDMAALKALLTEKLDDYALEPGKTAMNLVLFRDALNHVCRIHRVLMQPRGNALLVGVGGSGRKSLARLAAFVADLKCFQIEIAKNYRLAEFHEDLKSLYRQAGVQNKPTVFLFDETQIVVETFLECINNILTSGEVPNLFTKDELGAVCEELRAAAKSAGAGETGDEIYAFFIGRVISNLHVVLCCSPVGESFRERTRMFPGLVNCCTIDWCEPSLAFACAPSSFLSVPPRAACSWCAAACHRLRHLTTPRVSAAPATQVHRVARRRPVRGGAEAARVGGPRRRRGEGRGVQGVRDVPPVHHRDEPADAGPAQAPQLRHADQLPRVCERLPKPAAGEARRPGRQGGEAARRAREACGDGDAGGGDAGGVQGEEGCRRPGQEVLRGAPGHHRAGQARRRRAGAPGERRGDQDREGGAGGAVHRRGVPARPRQGNARPAERCVRRLAAADARLRRQRSL